MSNNAEDLWAAGVAGEEIAEARYKWDQRFLHLAQHIASWSKDPSTKVGAVIVDDAKRIVSTGYNGFPRQVQDVAERYENRELKYELIVHAEANALLTPTRPVAGCTLYVWPLPTCARCAALIVQAGIKRVVSPLVARAQRWQSSIVLANTMYEEAGIEVVQLQLEERPFE